MLLLLAPPKFISNKCNILYDSLFWQQPTHSIAAALKKSNLHYTRSITSKRVTSDRAGLRGLAAGRHSSEETSQLWQAVVGKGSNLIVLVVELQTYHTDKHVFSRRPVAIALRFEFHKPL